MIRLTKISLRGKYIGSNKRGLVVGGKPMFQGMPATLLMVDEDTYKFLLEGQKSGWFKIETDNYEQFCIARERIEYKSPVEPPVEPPTEPEPPTEQPTEPEVETKVKKARKTAKKKEVTE